jgi:hypothetical protein
MTGYDRLKPVEEETLKRTSKNVKNGQKWSNFDVFLSFLMDNLSQYDV